VAKGECPQFKLDFGDGVTGTSAGAAVSTNAGNYRYTVHHSYAAVGKKTIAATGLVKCKGTAVGEADIVTAVVNGTTPNLPPKAPGPFVLTTVFYKYPARNPVVANAVNGVATVPYPSKTWPRISDESTVSFSFMPPAMSAAAKASLDGAAQGGALCAQANGCAFKFTLTKFNIDVGPKTDYSAHAKGYMTYEGEIVVEIPKLELAELFEDNWNYIIDLEWTFQGQVYKTGEAMIKRGEKFAGNYFEQYVYPTFQSARCQTCHSMGDHDTVLHQHDIKGVKDMDGFSDAMVGAGPHDVCANCHFPPHVSDWRTPPFSLHINWKEMTGWQQTCNTVVSHLSTGTTDESQVRANLRNHFHNDPRVKWAISDALTFPPKIEQLERAPPGNWDAWLAIIDPWIELWTRCSSD
jgi:hypothetical protein